MDFLSIKNETEHEFQAIANKLFHEYAIQTHNSIYRITELEFYWHSPTHEDKSVYERKHVDPELGSWYFHYSGVDIALKNKINGGIGGILLRSVYDINQQKSYKGPMVSAMRLFSGTNAFEKTIETKIIQHLFPQAEIICKPRVGLGKNAVESGTHERLYNFSITHIQK
jgi:hypothetical protein